MQLRLPNFKDGWSYNIIVRCSVIVADVRWRVGWDVKTAQSGRFRSLPLDSAHDLPAQGYSETRST